VEVVSKTVVPCQDSLQSYDRVRSAVGGKPRRHGGRWRDTRHEASQALEERREVGRVVGETKPTPPRGESGGRAEGAAGGGSRGDLG